MSAGLSQPLKNLALKEEIKLLLRSILEKVSSTREGGRKMGVSSTNGIR